MGPRSIHIDFNSRPGSEESDDDDLHETGGHGSLAGASPLYSIVHPHSQSGSSSHPGDYHLAYPSELQEPDVYAYDSAPRPERRERTRPQASRSRSDRRDHHSRHRRVQTAGAPRPRARPPPPPTDSPTEESEDSAEEFLEKSDFGPGMARPQSYYGPPNGYTQSSSSGSYGYPPVPHAGQMVHYAVPPPHGPPVHGHYQQHQHHQHHQRGQHGQYPPMTSPPAMGYPPAAANYHPGMNQHPGAHPGHAYRQNPYGPQSLMPYPPPQGYFPPGYPGQYGQPYGQPPPHPYPAPPLPAFMHEWQVASRKASPPPKDEKAVAVVEKKSEVDQDEIVRRMETILLAANAEREAQEKDRQLAIQSAEDKVVAIKKAEQERAEQDARIRADAMRAATEQAEAAAKAQAARAEAEARIREDAIRAAHKAIADKAAADAEQAAREARIRKEAAEQALEAAAKEAKAKADQEAKEAKIAADAAEAAKTAAEKKAAEDAAKAQDDAKTAKDEAEKKVKEAEEAAAKAKAEAEAAQAAAAAAAPPDKKPPVRFKDAIGRSYNFPWDRCCKWRDMETLIVQAFQHIEDLGEHVINGRYDLIGPDKEIILPQYWDAIVVPDMHITMMLWPLPEKPPPEPEHPIITEVSPDMIPPAIPDGVIDLDELLNPRGRKEKKSKKQVGNAFSNWMLGGAPSRSRKTLKDKKKPVLVAV